MNNDYNNKDFALILCIVLVAVVIYFILNFIIKNYISFPLINGFTKC